MAERRARDRVNRALNQVAGRQGAEQHMRSELAASTRALLDVEQRRLLPALEGAVTWQVLEDLGEKVRAGRH